MEPVSGLHIQGNERGFGIYLNVFVWRSSVTKSLRQTEGLLMKAVDSFVCRFSNRLSLLLALMKRI